MTHLPLLPWRRLFHLGAGTVLAGTTLLPWAWTVGLLGGLSALAVATELLRLRNPRLGRILSRWLRPLLKPSETQRVTGASMLAWGSLGAVLLFGPQAARLGILVQAWGDPLAGVVGTLWGRHPLPRGKTLEGSLAYLLGAGVALATLTVLGWGVPWWVGLIAAGVATLGEALSPPPDDNLWGPLVGAGVVWALGIVAGLP
ncbi:MAG: hypothetical protein NZ951_07620 [Dehalococcoidia bacterium]|nr:hypothetical protein [Dehalococcoidia bacterium]MDW8120594.1 hypothetical protein [Chloroflexota bacterium]